MRLRLPPTPEQPQYLGDYAGAAAGAIDGIHADDETQVFALVAVDVYEHAGQVCPTNGGESGGEALRRRLQGPTGVQLHNGCAEHWAG